TVASLLFGEKFREIGITTAPLESRGNRISGSKSLTDARAFVIREEESFAAPNRAADGETELVLAIFAFGNASRIFKEVRCVQLVIADELPDSSVKLVGSSLDGSIQDSAARTSHLRTIVVGLDLEFLNSIHRRTDDISCPIQKIDEIGVVVHAVEQIVILRRTHTIRGKTSARAQAARVLLALGNSDRELREKREVAPVQRQGVDSFRLDHLSHGSLFCLKRWRCCIDNYRLDGLANRQGKVDNHLLLHIHRDVILPYFLKSLDFRRQRIMTDLYRREGIFADRSAGRRNGDSRTVIYKRHGSAGDDTPAGIFDCP